VEFISAFSAKKIGFLPQFTFCTAAGKAGTQPRAKPTGTSQKNAGASPAFFKGLSKASGC